MKIKSRVTSMSRLLTIFLNIILAGSFLFTSLDVSALGQLMVSPTRIVFEGNERSKQINLINNGSEAGKFRISFVRKKMTSDGRFEVVEEGVPGKYSDEMVRFSPRQVTLAPGQSQTVRLMLRKKKGTADGEYRSHMLFQSLPDAGASDVNELADNKSGELSIKLVPVVGISIPVIVRQGSLDVEINLSEFEIKQSNTVKAQSILSLKLNRKGNKSAYGDFRVSFTPKGGTPVIVGQVNGVAIYTSIDSRALDIKLQVPDSFNLSNGELHVIYLEPGEDKESGVIAESRLVVP